MNSGVKWQRQRKEEGKRPDDGTDDERVTTSSITDRLEWVDDCQVAVDTQQSHGENAGVQVHAEEYVH